MSQYYSIRVGNIHDEDYEGWIKLCSRLKTAGLLDEEAEMMDYHMEADHYTMWQILQAFIYDDPHPERYAPPIDLPKSIKPIEGSD